MPAYKTGKKTQQYTTEFKATAVKLTHLAGATVKGVAESLDIHPFMLSRWRKDYREGKIMSDRRRKKLSKPMNLSENEKIAELQKKVKQLELENDLPKKVATIRRGGKSTKFRFISQFKQRFPIAMMCRFLKVSRAGYYAFCKRKMSRHKLIDDQLAYRIKQIFTKSRETYGSPRVHAELKRSGIYTSRKRVARLMREHGLKARCSRVYIKMAKLHRFYQSIKNIRKDMPKPTAVNEQWAGDLTYIRQGNRWLYLAVVIDLYSRKVIGWSMNHRKTTAVTMASLQMAFRNRKPQAGLVFHTDRGAEYRAHEVQALLSNYGVTPSMNRPGHCTDNAEMESFFHTLKGELIKSNHFSSEWDLRDKVAGYVQHFYNRFRLHSSLKYLSPVEYEGRAKEA
ncbi:IS3 family transposase [Agarivorans aestuarii]|uniref:IS3 family transposase n=1 Tax=Agarivorans aestuarii TaxID=1563703 RepID=A0ABU7GAS8_9ALTE|nr:IS3 family transposase [Agarivorans aestuarii]MEE1676361.1 IS3 family transposase [Agarivorans aestuarii]